MRLSRGAQLSVHLRALSQLWKWFEPYFLDDEEFTPGTDKTRVVTIGKRERWRMKGGRRVSERICWELVGLKKCFLVVVAAATDGGLLAGEYIQSLLTEDKYFSTVLPRLPVLVKNEYGAQLMALPQHRKRKKFNKRHLDAFTTGAKCIALSK